MNLMRKEERSLLLYLETCAVDYGGKMNLDHLNAADWLFIAEWTKSGLIESGRVAAGDIRNKRAHWCRLSEEAWEAAHKERRARAERMWKSRTWETTKEKRG